MKTLELNHLHLITEISPEAISSCLRSLVSGDTVVVLEGTKSLYDENLLASKVKDKAASFFKLATKIDNISNSQRDISHTQLVELCINHSAVRSWY